MTEIERKPSISHGITVASKMLGMTDRRMKIYEQTTGNAPDRTPRGGLTARTYSLERIFDIAMHKRTTGEAVTLPDPISVVVFLPKGGCGKSTLSTELAVQWSLRGLRVLLVDLDPQASSTFIFGYDPEADMDTAESLGLSENEVIQHTFANLHDFKEIYGSKPSVPFNQVVKKPYGENGPHLIPADVSLSNLNYQLFQANNRDYRIASWIKRGRTQPDEHLDLRPYDIILFDNAPATSVVSRASLVGADFCISPIRLDALSAKSMSFIASELTALVDTQLPCPSMIAVPTFFSINTQRSNIIMQGLWANYADYLVQSKLRASEIFPKSLLMSTPRDRMPVGLRNPTNPVVIEDLTNISNEILARFQAQ